MAGFEPQSVLDLWFPDNGHWNSPETHREFWDTRMQGGMDATIIANFAALTKAAARCELDHWAENAPGRLALLIALDQFPRSLWRDTPAAYAQDIKANRLVLEGISNGHFNQHLPWERMFYVIALGHCEGPDHLARFDLVDEISEGIIADLPPALAGLGDRLRSQNATVRSVIERFGRHPHRNAIFGRLSSPAEEAYIETGEFPHLRRVDD
ncbi:MAG: DUF924 family protein [Pseudomonadota bacterium]